MFWGQSSEVPYSLRRWQQRTSPGSTEPPEVVGAQGRRRFSNWWPALSLAPLLVPSVRSPSSFLRTQTHIHAAAPLFGMTRAGALPLGVLSVNRPRNPLHPLFSSRLNLSHRNASDDERKPPPLICLGSFFLGRAGSFSLEHQDFGSSSRLCRNSDQ